MSKLIIKNRYGVIPNDILNNKKISFKAKGLFGFLQSKPDGWSFSVKRICSQTKDGKDSITSGIKELEKAKLLQRKPTKNKNGKWDGYDYILSDYPFPENPSTVYPLPDNGVTLSKKDNSKKDNSNKDKDIKKKKFTEKDKKLVELLQNTIIERYPHLEGKFNFEKDCEEMNKLHRLDNWTYEQIEAVAKWSQEDQFWRQNIRSVSNLRKHFDKLVIKIKEQRSINQSTKQWIT